VLGETRPYKEIGNRKSLSFSMIFTFSTVESNGRYDYEVCTRRGTEESGREEFEFITSMLPVEVETQKYQYRRA
jgi:hypothetical protein